MSEGQRSGLPCVKCSSSDAMTIYPKGDAYCFSCESYISEDNLTNYDDMYLRGSMKPSKPRSPSPSSPTGSYQNVPERGIQEVTARHYGVKVGQSGHHLMFPIFTQGKQTGQKIKNLEDKTFTAVGNAKEPDFFGEAQAGGGGKLLIITEGEEDCMSAHQLLQSVGKNYKVVSLPNGANTSTVKRKLNWLENFETIILNLDNDDKGREAAVEIAKLLTPGKAKIMSLPSNMKDNNQWLLSGAKGDEYLRRLNNAKPWRPDGLIVTTWESFQQALKEEEDAGPSIPYPWSGLNRLMYGSRAKELVTWTAGTGIGKSAVMREIEHHLLQTTRDRIGVLALEESIGRSMWGVVAVEANKNLAIREEREKLGITKDSPEVKEWYKKAGMEDRMIFLSHFGMTGEKDLMSTVRYMIKGLGCKHIVLDHLAIVVSGMDVREDERKTIDRIMTHLRQLTEETRASLHLVAHLRRIEGAGSHEQGREIELSHLRGSQAIAQLSDAVVAMERNQQADNEKEANLTRLRVLKNRYAGMTGVACHLAYDRDTGRLSEIFNVDEYLAPSTEEAGC